jgi:hypothetical protein
LPLSKLRMVISHERQQPVTAASPFRIDRLREAIDLDSSCRLRERRLNRAINSQKDSGFCAALHSDDMHRGAEGRRRNSLALNRGPRVRPMGIEDDACRDR